MINPISLITNLISFALVGMAGALLLRFIGGRVSKKLSIRLIGLYTIVLLISPILAGFIVEDFSEREKPIDIPAFYFEEVLEDYEERSLEDLKQDEYLRQLTVSEILVDIKSFSEDSPLVMASSEFNYIYNNHLIIEITDTVDQVVITEFRQRHFIDNIDISKEFTPWNWTISSKTLRSEIPKIKVDLYSLAPTRIAFHFDPSLPESLPEHQNFGQSFGPIPSEGVIQWIQIPEELEFYYRGRGPWRIKR